MSTLTNNTKRFTLAEAIALIAEDNMVTPMHITMIEFEDGSGRKFNYRMAGPQYFCEINPAGYIGRNTYRDIN